MTATNPAQKFVRYSTHVDTITAAWAFVMERMDEFVRPTIQVEACTTNSGDDGEWVDGYDATVYGDVTETEAHA